MIKSIVRAFVFSLISLRATQYVIDGFSYNTNASTFLLVVIGLTLLYFMLKPLLSIISLPVSGVGFLFISTVLTLVTLHALTLFISGFGIHATTISDLIVFGFVLPSKDLTGFWSGVFSALLISVVFTFFDWLCSRR